MAVQVCTQWCVAFKHLLIVPCQGHLNITVSLSHSSEAFITLNPRAQSSLCYSQLAAKVLLHLLQVTPLIVLQVILSPAVSDMFNQTIAYNGHKNHHTESWENSTSNGGQQHVSRIATPTDILFSTVSDTLLTSMHERHLYAREICIVFQMQSPLIISHRLHMTAV